MPLFLTASLPSTPKNLHQGAFSGYLIAHPRVFTRLLLQLLFDLTLHEDTKGTQGPGHFTVRRVAPLYRAHPLRFCVFLGSLPKRHRRCERFRRRHPQSRSLARRQCPGKRKEPQRYGHSIGAPMSSWKTKELGPAPLPYYIEDIHRISSGPQRGVFDLP